MLTGNYNRAMKANAKTYCGKACFYLDRKGTGKPAEQKKKEKAEYDRIYRASSPTLKQRRAAWFKKDYEANPEKYRNVRQSRYAEHLKYIQSDKYKAWKSEYDKKYLAKKQFGVYWESALLLNELEEFLLNKRPDGIKFQMGITNKTQKRKRLWQRQKRQQKSSPQQI